MTPSDWLAPSAASRTRVSYTGRRGGALVVEFELDALAAGDVLDRHLARRRLVASQARKIDDGEALGRRLDRRGDVRFCPTPPPLAEDDPRPAAPAETNAGPRRQA